MSSLEATTSRKSSSSTNHLIHEVHDNFDFEYGEALGTEPRPIRTVSPFEADRNAGTQSRLNDVLKSYSPSAAASYFNQNFDENGYVFDGVKIEIDDIDNTSISNATTSQLKRCKKEVLKHYYSLLCFIGWRPVFKEDYYRMPCIWRLFNVFYPLLIIFLLFFAYTYEVVTCAGKLNVVYDTEVIEPFTMRPALRFNTTTTAQSIITTTTPPHEYNFFERFSTKLRTNSGSSNDSKSMRDLYDNETSAEEKQRQCGHIVTTYIVPSLMHFVAFILGFIYFRVSENEQLYSLMEKVFLAVNNTMKTVSQDKVIKRLRLFIFVGVLWVVLAMSMQILQRLAFGFSQDIYKPYWVFLIIQATALVIMNSIYLAVVINHATQCELIIFFVNELRTRLEEKSITLKEAMQQLLDIRMSLGSLNSTVAKMTSLVALTFLEKVIIGTIILVMNKNNVMSIWFYRVMFTFSWFIIFAFTIIQVARVNSKCHKFKQIALSSRVYGYGNSSREELDSFMLFVSNAKLRGKLFGVPLQPSYIIACVIIIIFTAIVLLQSSVFTPPDSYV